MVVPVVLWTSPSLRGRRSKGKWREMWRQQIFPFPSLSNACHAQARLLQLTSCSSFSPLHALRVCFYFTVKDWAQLTCIQHGGHDHHELDGADELFVANVRALMNEVWVFKQSDRT